MTRAPTQDNPPSSPGNVLRITPEEARAGHVDDLLKRYASLRGEQGITVDRGRKWYYQNWFVFMIAGALGALLGYGLLDSYFDDLFYIQGTVGSIDRMPDHPIRYTYGGEDRRIDTDRFIEAQVSGRPVAFTTTSLSRDLDGKYSLYDLGFLAKGQTLGVYVLYAPDDQGDDHSVARFIVPNGKPRIGSSLSLRELSKRKFVASLLLFPAIAAFIGLFIGAADGIMCRLFRRVLLAGAIGLVFGLIGGFLSGNVLAQLVYAPLTEFAARHAGALGFSLQTAGRGLAWALAGMAMGLGQGIALRSERLLLYGFIGGLVGGLLGGLLFDPIDLLVMGPDKPSASVSRWIGFGVIGATVGLMIGIVERLARDAWLRMVEGPLAGKEFLVFKDVMRMGASPRSEIYLFNDPAVAAQHAVIRATGDIYELENSCRENPVCVNGRPIQRSRLRHGDRISLGRTSFVFERQRAD